MFDNLLIAIRLKAEESEWGSRRNRATEVKHMSGSRYMTVCISDHGTDLGSMTLSYKRGKQVGAPFWHLPAISK